MSFQEYPCDICGCEDAVLVPHCEEYTQGQPIYICKDCGLVYVKNRRSPEEMAVYWDEEVYDGDDEDLMIYNPVHPVFQSRRVFARALIQKYLGDSKGKLIFDIGIGEGQFLELMRNDGAQVFGVESSKKNCAILNKKNIPHFQGTIEQFNSLLETGQSPVAPADVATIIFVLQNCQSATDMIAAAYNLLAPNGHLLIEMGSRILVPFKKPMGTYFHTLPQDEQPYHFSIGTLQCLLAKCGFEIIATNNYWDDDLMCVIARKKANDTEIKWMKDDYREVVDFFERWHAETRLMKKYIKFPPLKYDLPSHHTFYKDIRTK